MWNKLSHAFSKNPSRTSLQENDRADDFHSSEVPFPSPNAPPSPKNRKSFFKHEPTNDRPASPFTIPGLSKKVKSLHINTNFSEVSLARPSEDSAVRPCPIDKTPSTPFGDHTGGFGSLRSILRDRNTPSTGQNVRFFSRDAYKTISPNNSEPSAEPEDVSFFSRLKINGKNTAPARSESVRPSARDVFASLSAAQEEPTSPVDGPHALNSLMMPVPPPDVSNIFDMSQEQNIPTIAPGTQSAMLEDAVEVHELPTVPESEGPSSLHPQGPSFTSTPHRTGQETVFFSPNEGPGSLTSEGTKSFASGHPVFHPPLLDTDSPASSFISDKRSSKSSIRASEPSSLKSRSRALSDSVFQTMIRVSKEMTPETQINDTSGAIVAHSSTSPEPDPFRANATTYYTPGTMMPPSPPQLTHTRKVSREEDMIWSLRTQLALQQELCAQYEVDLGARNELVNALNEKLDSADKDKQHRNSVLRGWKKKVQELERVCRGLEEEVDKTRQESLERSVMDEASSEALRELHRVIGRLEREKADSERKEKEERQRRDAEVETLKAELKKSEDAESRLREGIKDAKEQMEIMGKHDDDEITLRLAESAWAEERAEFAAKITELEKRNLELLTSLQDEEKGNEFEVLKIELEAQWKHTELMTEKLSQLEKEKAAVKLDLEHTEKRIADMEVDWNESENRRSELETEFQEIVSEKNELEEQLEAEREHVDGLTQALHDREETVSGLETERQYTRDNVCRLEENLRQRDMEIANLSERIVERESEAEELRTAVNKMQKERGRDADEQIRTLQEMTLREGEVRRRMESLVIEKAENDVLTKSLKERVGALNEELERLRRQVHDLQQESADKEVRVSQFGKWRDQDKEDIRGLNIALDSKQQELELLKRKLGVRGTAGSTPGPARRKESSMFATPTVIRPPSALSDASKEGTKDKNTSTMVPKTLAKSVRVNAPVTTALSSSTSAKPARPEGSMGPPPSRRLSATGTPSRFSSTTHTRSPSGSSVQPTSTKPAVMHRRTSSDFQPPAPRPRPSVVAAAARGSSPTVSERDEKENNKPSMTPTPKAIAKRPSIIAA